MKYLVKSTVFITSLVLSQLTLAQIQFEQVIPAPPAPQIITEFEPVDACSLAFADVDGDGDPDVLVTGFNEVERTAILYLNDGSGGYTEVEDTPFDGVWFSAIAFADVDGDEDQDVLITGQNTDDEFIAKLYFNDGSGVFTEAIGTPFTGVFFGSVSFADVDGDSDQDVLITGFAQSILYTNDGSGVFTQVTGTPFIGVSQSAAAFADVDGDNDQDLLITGMDPDFERTLNLYLNDGSGAYTIQNVPNLGVRRGSISFADVDGDGDQDLLLTGRREPGPGFSSRTARIFLNDGFGEFSPNVPSPFKGVDQGTGTFADIDGDGDQDVLITGLGRDPFVRPTTKLYTNDGSAGYTEVEETPFAKVSKSSVAFADVDGDGDQDVFIAGATGVLSESNLYLNDGSGTFTEIRDSDFNAAKESAVAFADVDGDNDQDVLVSGGATSLYTNDGTGSFTEMTETPFVPFRRGSVDFADIDGDGDQDVLITGEGFPDPDLQSDQFVLLYTNDGNGGFTEVEETPFVGVFYSSADFADVDGDGDQDVLIIGNPGGALEFISKLYLNDGSGVFTEVADTPFIGVSNGSVDFADVDGDGDQDVLITGDANFRTSRLYLNNGTGIFTEDLNTPFYDVYYSSAVFGDVDGDGDQDVLITGAASGIGRSSILYTNNGSGVFTEVIGTPFTGVWRSSVDVADVDGDNDLDLLITGQNFEQVPIAKLYRNDGNGEFTEVEETVFEGVFKGAVAFADVDGDNDPDLLITGENEFGLGGSKLYRNITSTCSESFGAVDEASLNYSLIGRFATFAWAPLDNQLGCQVELSEAEGGVLNLFNIPGAEADGITFPIGGLQHNTLYEWRVRCACSLDPLITGPWSSSQSFILSFFMIELSPNPTAGMSAVTFNSDFDGYTEIEVFDTGGRLVEALFSGVVQSDENYRLEFDASSLPNGIYLVRASGEWGATHEKMIISK